MSDNINKYNSERPLADNLERILEIDLPLPISEESEADHLNLDCGICYVYKLQESIPTEVCDKCTQPFHIECLYEYLSTAPNSTKSRDTIYGKCPFCDADITCRYKN